VFYSVQDSRCVCVMKYSKELNRGREKDLVGEKERTDRRRQKGECGQVNPGGRPKRQDKSIETCGKREKGRQNAREVASEKRRDR